MKGKTYEFGNGTINLNDENSFGALKVLDRNTVRNEGGNKMENIWNNQMNGEFKRPLSPIFKDIFKGF